MDVGKIKVLHVIGIMNYGGAETMIMNLYRKIIQSMILCMVILKAVRQSI